MIRRTFSSIMYSYLEDMLMLVSRACCHETFL